MEELQEIYNTNPNTEEIALSRHQVNQLEELLPLLTQFRNLRKLNLTENKKDDPSQDIGSLNIYATIDCLANLPHLQSLYINLDEEEQVDYIMKRLPNLEYLNGLEVERDDEEEEEEESEEDEEKEVHVSPNTQSDKYHEDDQEHHKENQEEESFQNHPKEDFPLQAVHHESMSQEQHSENIDPYPDNHAENR